MEIELKKSRRQRRNKGKFESATNMFFFFFSGFGSDSLSRHRVRPPYFGTEPNGGRHCRDGSQGEDVDDIVETVLKVRMMTTL